MSFAVLPCLFWPATVYGASYGSGPYGHCSFQSCGPSTVVTVPPSTTTKAPLEVNINLANGQIIPRSGYTIIVTPLNGAGTSFQSVQFFVDGSNVHAQIPDAEGTVSWFWNVSRYPGTHIRVIITGTDGQSVIRSFVVSMAALPAPAAPSIVQQLVSVPAAFSQHVRNAVATLPSTVKYSLPYILFLLLGGDILLMLYRMSHEITESRRLQAVLTRERQYGELKHTFRQLVSHYLRTPITIIGGGLDLARTKGKAAPPAVEALNGLISQLASAIDGMLAQLSAAGTPDVDAGRVPGASRGSVLRQPSLYLPIVVIGIAAFWFDYLAQRTNGFTVGQSNLLVQVVVFLSLCVVIYQLLRHRALARRVSLEAARAIEAEVAFNADRDQTIAFSVNKISKLVDGIAAQSALLPADTKKFTDGGVAQLQDIVRKLLIANQLQGSRTSQPYSPVQLDTLVQEALKSLDKQLSAKQITVQALHDTGFQTQSPELLAVVLRTILDNAVAYSGQGGSVEVDAAIAGNTVSITITDHGEGIPEDKQFSLFKAFSKTEGAETFNHEGMGFSLYLDKLIMNYLVGDITLESKAKHGTTVTLSLPQPY